MTKEKIFSDLQELVKTLQSPNIKNPNVIKLWREKAAKFQEAIDGMNSCDMVWLSSEFKLWSEDIKFLDDVGLRQEFPWI